ncbi:MAG: alpha/beta hydrolase, partial [Pseudomonadota bacterium]
MKATPSPSMQTIIDRLAVEDAGKPDPTTLPPEEGRALAAANAHRWIEPKPEMTRVEDITLAGRDARLLVPGNDEGNGAILYIHGGGWAFCSLSTHETIARALAVEAAAPVITVSYRLAPENP